jgi:hypothetical protein
MCFRIPFLDFFFKKKTILGDDDGSTSPMPWYSHKSHGVYHSSVRIDERYDIVVDSFTCNYDDDDDDDVVFINNSNNKPQPTFSKLMCFYFPFSDTFLRKKGIAGDDDGLTSSMPGLHEFYSCVRIIGVNISPGQDPHLFDTLVYTDDDVVDVVVDLLPCDDDDDDDDDDRDEDGGLVWNKPGPPWDRYYAMIKREKDRHLDMEIFYTFVAGKKKEEDRRRRILDLCAGSDDEDRDDSTFTVVDADVALSERQASAPDPVVVVDGPIPSFDAVQFPMVEFDDRSVSSVPELVFRTDDDRVHLARNDDGPVMYLLKDCARSLVAGCDEESVADEVLFDEVLLVLLERYNGF